MPEGTNIATQITRIANDRNTIRNKMIDFGLAESTANLDALATAVSGIANNGAVSAQVKEGETYTIPKGYHNGSGTVSGVAGGGNYNLQSKSIAPTKSQQNVTPTEGSLLSSVTVGAIPAEYVDTTDGTATAAQILTGRTAYVAGEKVTGTMPNNSPAATVLDTETASYTIPAGYHDGTGSVSLSLETKSATPTKAQQTIEPSDGKVLSAVTVEAIPAKYVDTSSGTAAAGDILTGKTAFVKGSAVTGSMPNNGATNLTIDGMQTTSVSVPAGYTTGGTVSLTDSIEKALAAI